MLSAQNSPRKLPQRTRKVSESVGLVGGGVWAGGGHGVSLDARPPCGDNSPRPRHAKWLLKHAKNGENFRSTPLRPCRMSPALVYRGSARGGEGEIAHGGRLWHSKLQVAAVTSRYGR